MDLKSSFKTIIARFSDSRKIDSLKDLPDEVIFHLEQAVQESEDLTDAIPHDQVMQELRHWLNK